MDLSNPDDKPDEERRAKLRRKKTYRRDQRPETPRGMYLTTRDREVLRLVYDYRILSQKQIERLLGRSRGTVQERLIRLYHHQFLDRIFLPVVMGQGRSPTLYVLDKTGIELLREEGLEDFSGRRAQKLTGLFLHHTMALNDVRIAVTLGAKALDWNVAQWIDENEIKAGYDKMSVRVGSSKPESVPIVPDSYFVLDIPNRGVSNFFVEVDRGTETVGKFKSKVAGYVAYYKSGAFERRFNASGFRVLTVVAPSKITDMSAPTSGETRLTRLKAEAETLVGVGRRFWFALQKDVGTGNLLKNPCWRVTGSEDFSSLFGEDV